jgi:short-subunit dehydrogenase
LSEAPQSIEFFPHGFWGKERAMSFADKVAIVTGASSGIGLAVAEKLVLRGCRVAMVARTRGPLEAAANRLGAQHAVAFAMDVSDLETLVGLPERVLQRFGRLDYVVHNAGLNHRGPAMDHPAKSLAAVINVNLVAPIVLTRASAEHMTPGGSMVYVASLAGMVPVPGEATYSASKAGLRAFSRALADEFAARKIHCGIVSPGPVDTNFFGAEIERVADLVFSQPISTSDEVAEAVIRCIEQRKAEIAIPGASGLLATSAYVFPQLAAKIRPMLERRGRKAKLKYAAAKRSERASSK